MAIEKSLAKSVAALVIGACSAAAANAATIYLTPSQKPVPAGTTSTTLDLMMNFSAAEATLGGGIDIGVSGAGSAGGAVGFVPSSWWTGAVDSGLSGFGTAHADKNLEVHFGHFNGLSGLNTIGTLTFGLTGVAGTTTTVSLAANTFWGGFVSATTFQSMNVTMVGGTTAAVITVVPEPQAALLLLAGLGAVGVVTRRRLQAA